MAGKRRGGFRPPELRGTLGTLLNTALQQAGVVRDALERGAREGRSKLDEVRSGRRRQDALAELGEIVLELIRRGEIDTSELPEADEVVRFLDELDAEDGPTARGRDRGDVVLPPTRRRFDERAGGADDGTVASGRWSPPRRAGRDTTVWRPPVADDPPASQSAEPPGAAEPPRRGNLPRDPNRKGGIAFDEDDDLADYMHPDDVPPKEPPGGDS